MKYGYTKKVELSFSEAIERNLEELPKEGFGVLTEINVKETLKRKLDLDMDDYIILGACNPSFAHKALVIEHEIGLLLPCNIIVYKKEGDVFVSAILPSVAMSMVENPDLQVIAEEIEGKLKKVINNL
jgi:uncharacterized protein (DUF302 family)